jgi:hypothetical protein
MNKTILLLCFSMLFLTSCTNSVNKKYVKKEEVSLEIGNNDLSSTIHESEPTQSSSPSASDNLYDSYSGEWVNWNNPENEADGGVSLKITVKNNEVTGNYSAWSKNYGRLADSDVSGNIQDHLCKMSFADDGRGHSGTILLTFGQEQITADISVQTPDTDFTFPSGTTVLRRKKVQSASEPVATEESSIPASNVVSSDNDMQILFSGDTENASSVKLTYGMSYDDVNRLLVSIGEQTTKNPWEEYSDDTLINKEELWSSIKTDEDYNKLVSMQKTLINSDKQYTFTFITQNNSIILTSILVGTPVIGTTKNIKCGDPVHLLTDQYGAGYNLYASDKYEIYEYKSNSGYVKFFIDPETKLIAEWGIDIYSYQDHLDMKNKLDRIFSH